MAAKYRVYKNGRSVAIGGYAASRHIFQMECDAANPFKDVVLLVDWYMNPIDSY